MSITEVVATAVESYITPEYPVWKIRYVEARVNMEECGEEEDPLDMATLDLQIKERLFQEKKITDKTMTGDTVDWYNNFIDPSLVRNIKYLDCCSGDLLKSNVFLQRPEDIHGLYGRAPKIIIYAKRMA
tara:strand:+ start:896 stop:1282 length:387 start_codon:yes stop_codon:yes gene_type:complete